jgi:hypothetical protein
MIMWHKIKKKIKKERKGKEMIGSYKEVVWEVKKEKGDVIIHYWSAETNSYNDVV